MIGELIRTKKGWIIQPPTHCPSGHDLTPGRMLVGFQPCGGAHPGGHMSLVVPVWLQCLRTRARPILPGTARCGGHRGFAGRISPR
jgi:hypothetical protein